MGYLRCRQLKVRDNVIVSLIMAANHILLVTEKDIESAVISYGSQFCYDEYMETPGLMSAVALTVALIVGISILLIRPVSRFPWLPRIYVNNIAFRHAT